MNEVYGGLLDEGIKVTIDGKPVFCPSNSSILEAAKCAGIEIPTLCYLKGLTPTGMCGVCAVEIENEDGTRKIRRACRYRAKDGMVIYTNSKTIDAYRKERMEKLLAIHPQDCLTCHKSNGNCKFQKVANNFADRYNLTIEKVTVPKEEQITQALHLFAKWKNVLLVEDVSMYVMMFKRLESMKCTQISQEINTAELKMAAVFLKQIVSTVDNV